MWCYVLSEAAPACTVFLIAKMLKVCQAFATISIARFTAYYDIWPSLFYIRITEGRMMILCTDIYS